jgi:hypothetical protein
MKTKLLLTALFSIGIIAMASAQEGYGYHRPDEHARLEQLHRDEWKVRRDERRFEQERMLTRHERKVLRREERRRERYFRHHPWYR